MKKIKINKLPEGFRRMPNGKIVKDAGAQKMQAGGQPILNPTSRAAANLEAEKGETVITDLNSDNIPEHYMIGGKKHSEGGTPLNLPPKSFIFSDHKSMSIKGDALKKFLPGTSKKKMTPAQIASSKKFDMSDENAILKDPNADKMAKATAERNIQSKLVKLGELAMEQEAIKSFENGIPSIAKPFLKRKGITPEQVEMLNAEIEQSTMYSEMAKYGKETYAKGGEERSSDNYTPDVSIDVAFGKDESPYTKDQVQKAINHWTIDQGRSKPKVSAEDFIYISNKYDIPIDFMLAMGAQEGYFGVAGRSDRTNNMFNWGNTTGGDYLPPGVAQDEFNRYFSDVRKGMSVWADGMNRLYKPEDGNWYSLLEDDAFVQQERGNAPGQGYATGKNHEKNLRNTLDSVYNQLGEPVEEGEDNSIYVDPNMLDEVTVTAQKPFEGKGDDPVAVARAKKEQAKKKEAEQQVNAEPADSTATSKKELPYQGEGDDPKDVSEAEKSISKIPEFLEEPKPIERPQVRKSLPLDLAKKEGSIPTPEVKGSPEMPVYLPKKRGVIPTKEITPNISTPVNPAIADSIQEDLEVEGITPGSPEYAEAVKQSTGFFPEDMVNVLAATSMRTPREYGYTQRLQPFLTDPTFYDPERELQANQEVGAINAQAMALQGRGQNLAANLSAMQGKLAANQANTLSRYNNLNVGVANQSNVANANAMNKFAEYNAGQNRQQRMDTATVNEGYANQLNNKRALQAKAFNTMLGNKRMADNISSMYENATYNPFTEEIMMNPSANPILTEDALASYEAQQARIMDAQAKLKADSKKQTKKKFGGQAYQSFSLSKFIKGK